MSCSTLLGRFIDLFYIAPLRRVLPYRTFRYAAAGGINMLLNVLLYFVLFHYILSKDDTEILGLVVISAPIMAFGIAFVITFCTGFYLTRTLAFGESQLRGRTQLFRYLQIVALNIAINYFGLKLLVDVLDLYPTPCYLFLNLTTIALSYFASRHYTFR